jgi:hypothetical protein
MKPEILLELINDKLGPGDELAGAFVIPGGLPSATRSVEFSVLWHTSGKGTEDLGVIFFQNWVEGQSLANLPNPFSFTVWLPQTPYTYDGELVKIHWVARLRIRYGTQGEILQEAPFTLRPRLG